MTTTNSLKLHPTQISSHALIDHSISQTLWVIGQIRKILIVILVNSGSTHKFLQDKVSKQLGLTTKLTHSFKVLVGNDDELNCTKLFHNMYSRFSKLPPFYPPKRLVGHVINLTSNFDPINVCPYRNPHFHKQEIEAQIKEMLGQGFVQPSTSALNSPILLVQKKDNT